MSLDGQYVYPYLPNLTIFAILGKGYMKTNLREEGIPPGQVNYAAVGDNYMGDKDKPAVTSNVVRLNWRRIQRAKSDSPLEERVTQLEKEMEKVIAILIDTTELAEKNRHHLLTLLRKLKKNSK